MTNQPFPYEPKVDPARAPDPTLPGVIHDVAILDGVVAGDEPEIAPPAPTTQCHVMLDLETWGKSPGAIIVAIGAVKFWPNEKPAVIGDKFYVPVHPASCARMGLQLDVDTVLWWMDQEQRPALDDWLRNKERWQDMVNALEGFAEWFGPESMPTWGNGPGFDNVILATAFRVLGREPPWQFRHDRDYRTIRGMVRKEWEPPYHTRVPPVHWHDALADAERQLDKLLAITAELGLTLS